MDSYASFIIASNFQFLWNWGQIWKFHKKKKKDRSMGKVDWCVYNRTNWGKWEHVLQGKTVRFSLSRDGVTWVWDGTHRLIPLPSKKKRKEKQLSGGMCHLLLKVTCRLWVIEIWKREEEGVVSFYFSFWRGTLTCYSACTFWLVLVVETWPH